MPSGSHIDIAESVVFAYNSQSREKLDGENLLWQEIVNGRETIQISPTSSIAARAYVAQFNFSGHDQIKRVKQLSGGERNRVQLAKALARGSNVIILDEPTNDLDVDTLRALEDALKDFEGSAVIVSHDRWFLDRVCSHILCLHGDGRWEFFRGSYSEFELDKKKKNGDSSSSDSKKRMRSVSAML